MERITRELDARNRMKEKAAVVYSTQQAAPLKRSEEKNKGCCPASNDIANYNPLDNGTSGRTRFWSVNDGSVMCYQEPKMHVQGERRGS